MIKTLVAALSVPVLSSLASPAAAPGWGSHHEGGNNGPHHGEEWGPPSPPHGPWQHGHQGPVCVVEASSDDSSPAILDAFARCGHNSGSEIGKVIFKNETYNIKQVMNTTGLRNVDVDLQGTLSWDNSDLPYWLNHSLPVGYQNQSSVSFYNFAPWSGRSNEVIRLGSSEERMSSGLVMAMELWMAMVKRESLSLAYI